MCLASGAVSLSFGDLFLFDSLWVSSLISWPYLLNWMSFPSRSSKTLKVGVMVRLHRSKLDNVWGFFLPGKHFCLQSNLAVLCTLDLGILASKPKLTDIN